MTPVKLRIVQCVNHLDGNCKAGHFGGRPSPLTCATCPHGSTTDGGPLIVEHLAQFVCQGERNKYPAAIWMRFEDERLGMSGAQLIVPLALYQQAIKHRE